MELSIKVNGVETVFDVELSSYSVEIETVCDSDYPITFAYDVKEFRFGENKPSGSVLDQIWHNHSADLIEEYADGKIDHSTMNDLVYN